MRTRTRTRVWLAAMLALLLVAAACGDDDDSESSDDTSDAAADDTTTDDDAAGDDETSDDAPDEGEVDVADPLPTDGSGTDPEPEGPNLDGELVGLFGIDPAECAVAGSESGSWFRMVQIGGTVEDGPFLENPDSPCADPTIIPLAPGTDGGLLTGELQPGTEPLFDEANNATADRIAVPTPFFGVAFAMATTDESTPPAITATAGELSGDLSAVVAYYGGLTFNQGSPKPDGSTPGITTPSPAGAIDDDTGEYELTWASQIVGGAFNEFTGVWHLEGTFTPTG